MRREVVCKTALSLSTLPGLLYSLNPYKGCQHNCAYCYGPSVLKIERAQWRDVAAKTNIPVVLSKELKRKRRGTVGVSTVTDPYQPLEETYKLTRYCLEQLLAYDFPVCIQTKSSLVTRDLDIITRFSHAEVILSIATVNDDERKILEPGSSSIQERIDAFQKISRAGVKTSVFFGPVYPTVTVADIPHIINLFAEQGVSKLYVDSLHLKPGVWENIQKTIVPKKKLYEMFVKNVIENKEYYQKIRNEVVKLGKQKNIEIVDAF